MAATTHWHDYPRVSLRIKRFADDRDGMLLGKSQPNHRPRSKAELERLHAGAIYHAIRATCVAMQNCPEVKTAGLVKIQRLAAELARRSIPPSQDVIVVEEEAE